MMRRFWILSCFLVLSGLQSISTKDNKDQDPLYPAWFEDAIGAEEKNGKIPVLDDCEMVYKVNNCMVHLKPQGQSCKRVLNFRTVLNGHWKLEAFLNLTESTLPSDNFYLHTVEIDTCQSDVTFVTKNSVTVNFVDRFLLLSDAMMRVVLKGYKKQVINNSKIFLTTSANVMFNQKQQSIFITKRYGADSFDVFIKAQKITIKDILLTFRMERNFFRGLCNVNKNILEELSCDYFKINGVYSMEKGLYLSTNVMFDRPSSKDRYLVEVVVLRARLQPVKISIVLKGNIMTNIFPFLSDFLKRPKYGIPLIDSIGQGILSLSGHEINRKRFDPDAHPLLMPKGVVLQTVSSLHDSEKSRTKVSQNLLLTKLKLCNKKDTIEFNPNENINFVEFLDKLSPIDPSFPKWLKSTNEVLAKITSVEYSGNLKENLFVKATISASLQLLYGSIKVDNIKLGVSIDKSKEMPQWRCEHAIIKVKLGSVTADVSLTCEEGLENFRVFIDVPCIGFKKILDLLKIDVISHAMQEKITKLRDFEIQNFRVEAMQNHEEFMRISGTPLLFGSETLSLEAMSWLDGLDKKFVMGIVLRDADLDELLKGLIGQKFGLAWIQRTTVAILISNTKLKQDVSAKSNLHINSTRHRRDATSDYLDAFGYYTQPSPQILKSYRRDAILQSSPVQIQTPNSPIYFLHDNTPVSFSRQDPSQNSPNEQYETQSTMNNLIQQERDEESAYTNLYNPTYEADFQSSNNFHSDPTDRSNILNTSLAVPTQSNLVPTVSIMDNLMNAYYLNNMEKFRKVKVQEKNLEEGVLDMTADRRSFSPKPPWSPPGLISDNLYEMFLKNTNDLVDSLTADATAVARNDHRKSKILHYSKNSKKLKHRVKNKKKRSKIKHKDRHYSNKKLLLVTKLNKSILKSQAYQEVDNLRDVPFTQKAKKLQESSRRNISGLVVHEANYIRLKHRNETVHSTYKEENPVLRNGVEVHIPETSADSFIPYTDEDSETLTNAFEHFNDKSLAYKILKKATGAFNQNLEALSELKSPFLSTGIFGPRIGSTRPNITGLNDYPNRTADTSPQNKSAVLQMPPKVSPTNSTLNISSADTLHHINSNQTSNSSLVTNKNKTIANHPHDLIHFALENNPEPSNTLQKDITNSADDDITNAVTVHFNINKKSRSKNLLSFRNQSGAIHTTSKPYIKAKYPTPMLFSPIKPPPLNTQQVMTDIEYPPKSYTNGSNTLLNIEHPIKKKANTTTHVVKYPTVNLKKPKIVQPVNVMHSKFPRPNFQDLLKPKPVKNVEEPSDDSLVNKNLLELQENSSKSLSNISNNKTQRIVTALREEDEKENIEIITSTGKMNHKPFTTSIFKLNLTDSSDEIDDVANTTVFNRTSNTIVLNNTRANATQKFTNSRFVNESISKDSDNSSPVNDSVLIADSEETLPIPKTNGTAPQPVEYKCQTKLDNNKTKVEQSLNGTSDKETLGGLKPPKDVDPSKNNTKVTKEVSGCPEHDKDSKNSTDTVMNSTESTKTKQSVKIDKDANSTDSKTQRKVSGDVDDDKDTKGGADSITNGTGGKVKHVVKVEKKQQSEGDKRPAMKAMLKHSSKNKSTDSKSKNRKEFTSNSFNKTNQTEGTANTTSKTAEDADMDLMSSVVEGGESSDTKDSTVVVKDKDLIFDIKTTKLRPINSEEEKQLHQQHHVDNSAFYAIKDDHQESTNTKKGYNDFYTVKGNLSSDDINDDDDNDVDDDEASGDRNKNLQRADMDGDLDESKKGKKYQGSSGKYQENISEVENGDEDEVDIVKKSDSSKDEDDYVNQEISPKPLFLNTEEQDSKEEETAEEKSDSHHENEANVNHLAQIVSMYQTKVHHEGLPKFVALTKPKHRKLVKPKPKKSMYLVKNKDLQVVMEIRPDSKSDKISVETQGLENLMHGKKADLSEHSLFHSKTQRYHYHKKNSSEPYEYEKATHHHFTPKNNSNEELDAVFHSIPPKISKHMKQNRRHKHSSHILDHAAPTRSKLKISSKIAETKTGNILGSDDNEGKKLKMQLEFLRQFNAFTKEMDTHNKYSVRRKDDANIDGDIEDLINSELRKNLGTNNIETISHSDTQKKTVLNKTYIDSSDSDPIEGFQASKFEGARIQNDLQKKNLPIHLANGTFYQDTSNPEESMRDEVSSAIEGSGDSLLYSRKITSRLEANRKQLEKNLQKMDDIVKSYMSVKKMPEFLNSSLVEFYKRSVIPETFADAFNMYNSSVLDSDFDMDIGFKSVEGHTMPGLNDVEKVSDIGFKSNSSHAMPNLTLNDSKLKNSLKENTTLFTNMLVKFPDKTKHKSTTKDKKKARLKRKDSGTKHAVAKHHIRVTHKHVLKKSKKPLPKLNVNNSTKNRTISTNTSSAILPVLMKIHPIFIAKMNDSTEVGDALYTKKTHHSGRHETSSSKKPGRLTYKTILEKSIKEYLLSDKISETRAKAEKDGSTGKKRSGPKRTMQQQKHQDSRKKQQRSHDGRAELRQKALDKLHGIDSKINMFKDSLHEEAVLKDKKVTNEEKEISSFVNKEMENLKDLSVKIKEFKGALKEDLAATLRTTKESKVSKETIGTTKKGKGKELSVVLAKPQKTSKNAPSVRFNFTKDNVSAQHKLISKLSNDSKEKPKFNPTHLEMAGKVSLEKKSEKQQAKFVHKIFLTEELKELTVVEGVSVSVQVSPPETCGDDNMCTFIRENMGDEALRLGGSFSSDGVQFSMIYPGTASLTRTVSLESQELEMDIEGESSTVYIEAELKLLDPPLTFTGKICVGASGKLEFDMNMNGRWNKAFGIEFLSINSAMFSMSYQPGAPVQALELSGELLFGVSGSGHETVSKIYVGFDMSDPTGNYFYGKIDRLTVADLMKALNKSIALPQPLLESVFPEGLLVAFTTNPKGKEIVDQNLKIEFGFILSGIISILGYEVSCSVRITTAEIIIDIKMTPMDIGGGAISLHRSQGDSRHGPYFYVQIAAQEFTVKAEGAACLMGIDGEATLLVSNTYYNLNVKISMFDIMDGSLLLEAKADENLSAAKFMLESCLNIKVDKLMRAITKRLEDIAEAAKKAVQRVKDQIQSAKNVYTRAKEKLEEKIADVEKTDAEVSSEAKQIIENRRAITKNCYKSCPRVCHEGFIFDRHCVKILGNWMTCRKNHMCYKRKPQLDCILKCEEEKFEKRGLNVASKLSTWNKAATLKAKMISLNLAKMFLKLSEVPLQIAQRLSIVIEAIVQVGIKMGESLATLSSKDIFQFKHFCIRANMVDTDGFCVRFNMSMVLLKKELDLAGDVCINANVFEKLSEDAISEQYPESDLMNDRLMGKEKVFERIELAKNKATEAEKKLSDKETMNKAQRSYLPSAMERYYQAVLSTSEPGYALHPDIISSIYGRGEEYNFTNVSALVDALTQTTVDGRILPGSLITPYAIGDNNTCSNLSRTINIYSEIAKGLDFVLLRDKLEGDSYVIAKRKLESLLNRTFADYVNLSTYDRLQYDTFKANLWRGFHRWANETKHSLEKRQHNTVPHYVRELHGLLRHDDVTQLRSYMESLHDEAANSVKRSLFSFRTKSTESENIEDIKKGFENLFFSNDTSTLQEKINSVANVRRKISLAQTFNELCTVASLVTKHKTVVRSPV